MAKSVDYRGRGARTARRDEGAYYWYVTEEQRSRPGCIGRENDRLSHSRALSRPWVGDARFGRRIPLARYVLVGCMPQDKNPQFLCDCAACRRDGLHEPTCAVHAQPPRECSCGRTEQSKGAS